MQKRDDFHYELRTEDEVNKELIASAHTIVFLRNVEPSAYTYLEWAHELGKKTIYVIDDNFQDPFDHTCRRILFRNTIRRETYTKFLRNSQIIKVDSPVLGEYIQERFNRKVIYFPGSVDFDWLDQQDQLDAEPGQSRYRI